MLHPQAKAAIELWALDPDFTAPDADIDAIRADAREDGRARAKSEVAHVEDVDADGVPCRLYRPASGSPVLLHMHGGGFVFGDLETHDAHCRNLANVTGWAVLAIDYRRAPEHPYPAAPDDVDRVLAWIRSTGISLGLDTSRLAIMGDSAGGNLAFTAAYRNPGAFEAAILVYPCLDPAGRLPSYRRENGGLFPEEMDWYWERYLTATETRDAAELDPLSLDVSGLPPTLVITAEHDPLVDEGEELAAKIAAAGVPTVATRYVGLIHGFFGNPEMFDAADQADEQIAAFLSAQVRGAHARGRVETVGGA
jgi:acetyl esterase